MKVIHLPTTVGGNPQGISRHLRELGVESETWAVKQNYFGYPADKVITSVNDGSILRHGKKLFALRYVFQCDLVFFNFGAGLFSPYIAIKSQKISVLTRTLAYVYSAYSGFLAKIEVGLLKVLKKPIFIQYQGDDARQGDFCRSNFSVTFADQVEPGYYTEVSDQAKRKRITYYTTIAEKIYALNPDLLHVLPETAEFLPYSHISLIDWSPIFTQMEDRPLRIGHAPSHRGVKGTELIIDAAGRLKQAGYDFEFVLVEGLSNAEAKEVYKTVDVLVDQLFAGWYGGLAVEAMALGKPVVAYIRQEDLHFIPESMRNDLPIFQAEPNTIVDVLKEILVLPRSQLLEKAKQSRAYVEKWHDPVSIAKRIKQDMEKAVGKIR